MKKGDIVTTYQGEEVVLRTKDAWFNVDNLQKWSLVGKEACVVIGTKFLIDNTLSHIHRVALSHPKSIVEKKDFPRREAWAKYYEIKNAKKVYDV